MIGPFLLTEPETLIGRDPACQVALPLPPISRRHAVVRCSAAGCNLHDLGSANGTTLNGAPTDAGRQVLQSAVGHLPQIKALLKFLPAAQTPLLPGLGPLQGRRVLLTRA
mgnify:CR=1 FL=1